MEPDRVYGLQATRNFQKLLSEPAVGSSLDGKPHTIGERITTSPFKEEVDPLLFPFLIVEAKSAKSPNSFEDIKTQTAFPIFDLLKIQEHLQVRMTNSGSDSSPLVWFLASRGDAWRVYGCYVSASNPPRYVSSNFSTSSLDDSTIATYIILDMRASIQDFRWRVSEIYLRHNYTSHDSAKLWRRKDDILCNSSLSSSLHYARKLFSFGVGVYSIKIMPYGSS